MEDREDVRTHPSYGMAVFSRAQVGAGGATLFGSDFRHHQVLTLSIKRAQHHRKLSNDWYHGREELIEIEMSEAQFCELITNMNRGDGVPVTIRRVAGEPRIEPPPASPKANDFKNEHRKAIGRLVEHLQSVEEKLSAMQSGEEPMTKKGLKDLASRVLHLRNQLVSNIPYLAEQLGEEMERLVSRAKVEIDSYLRHHPKISAGQQSPISLPAPDVETE